MCLSYNVEVSLTEFAPSMDAFFAMQACNRTSCLPNKPKSLTVHSPTTSSSSSPAHKASLLVFFFLASLSLSLSRLRL